jgi:hypothetical protein
MMGNLLRLDTVNLAPSASPNEFEAFVGDELFPAFKAAFSGPPSRKTIASLDGLVLVKRCSQDTRTYTLASAWEGRLEDVADRDFDRATMTPHDEATAALRKLENFGRRDEPQIYEMVVGSVTFS